MKEIYSGSKNVPFNFFNYLRMFKAHGIRLPIYYFLQAQLFDLIHGTDTHKWVPKNFITSKTFSFDHYSIYMASWTCDIKKIFNTIHNFLGEQINEYTFIDIGCGKGKVLIVWALCCKKLNIKQEIIGIDILGELIEIAQRNHLKVLKSQGRYIVHDIEKIEPHLLGTKFILYLYNPFDEVTLETMLNRFSSLEILIVYNNPIHSDFLRNKGFVEFFKHKGFHGNLNTIGFRKPKY